MESTGQTGHVSRADAAGSESIERSSPGRSGDGGGLIGVADCGTGEHSGPWQVGAGIGIGLGGVATGGWSDTFALWTTRT